MDIPRYNTDAAKGIPSDTNDSIITNKKRRSVTSKLNDGQVKQLEEVFLQTLYPDNNMILNLSRKIHTNSSIIKKWFNSRRSKMMKSQILERVHVLPKVVTSSSCSYGTPKSRRQKTVLVRIDSPPRDSVDQAAELLRHSENILCNPNNNFPATTDGTTWPPKSSYQESYGIPTAGFQEFPTSCEDLPTTCYTELPRSYQNIPTTYYQEIPSTYYQEIPTKGGYQEIPTTSYQELPTTSYQELPTTSYQELPITSYQELPTTSYRELPITSYQDIPTTSYQEIPTTNYQELPSTSYQEISTTSYREIPTTNYREIPTTSYREMPTTNYQEIPTTSYQEILTTRVQENLTTRHQDIPTACHQGIETASYEGPDNDILELSDYELNAEQRLYKCDENAETIIRSPDVTQSPVNIPVYDISHCNTEHVLPNQITEASTVSYIYQVGDDPRQFTNLSNQLADISCQTTNISNQCSGQFADVSSSSNSPGNTNNMSTVESPVHMSLNSVVGKVNPTIDGRVYSIEDLKRLGIITQELTSETGARVTNVPETQTVCDFGNPGNNNTSLNRTSKSNSSKISSMRTTSTQTNYVEVENHSRSFATQTKPVNKIKDVSIQRSALACESSCGYNNSHMCPAVTPTIFPLLCIPISILPIENILQDVNKNLAPGKSIQKQCAAFHNGGCMEASWHPK